MNTSLRRHAHLAALRARGTLIAFDAGLNVDNAVGQALLERTRDARTRADPVHQLRRELSSATRDELDAGAARAFVSLVNCSHADRRRWHALIVATADDIVATFDELESLSTNDEYTAFIRRALIEKAAVAAMHKALVDYDYSMQTAAIAESHPHRRRRCHRKTEARFRLTPFT